MSKITGVACWINSSSCESRPRKWNELAETAPASSSRPWPTLRLREAACGKPRKRSKKRKNAKARAVGYAVVPYEGPNSTHRRPVYIECRGDSIVLQPEGVKITAEDFSGFLGPGNPLASALRRNARILRAPDAGTTGQRAVSPAAGASRGSRNLLCGTDGASTRGAPILATS